MARKPQTPAERAASAQRESRSLDFKERFDPSANSEWVGLVKDIVAMANSGGGLLVVGVCDNGQPSSFNVQPVLDLDPAKITDKVNKYTASAERVFGREDVDVCFRPCFRGSGELRA